MSKLNGAMERMLVAAVLAIVTGVGCSQSSSNNWNNMFGRKDDRRVEPRGANDSTVSQPKPGTSAARSETASNDYKAPDSAGDSAAPERGDPDAIQRYADNMNPPSNRGPQIQSNRPIADQDATNRDSSSMNRADVNPSAGDSTMSGGQSSPVRMATDRPANNSVQPGNTVTSRPPQPANNNTMFLNASSGRDTSGATAPTNSSNGGRLPTIEDRSSQPQPTAVQPGGGDSVGNGAPVISNVTAQPAERSPSRIEQAMRNDNNGMAGVNTGATGSTADATPAKDEAAERRRMEIETQEAKAAADPSNLEEQFKLRTMYLFDNRDEEAFEPIRGVTPDVQEIMLAQLRSMQAARSGTSRDPATWANRQLEAMRSLQEKLRAKADLQVPKVELCTEIKQFGVYTPFPSTDFKAGVPNPVLIYVEVDNFESRKMPSGEYRTVLGARLTLLSSEGRELVSMDDSNIEDISRGVRRDFFLAFGPITIPGNLPVGDYIVKVEIEDKLANKINSNTTKLRLTP
ncbi:MAG TPA: hypothetical protein P5081_15545 [Phycisphaerae bacterium]|nr:hypothetical protein [Phycisphaerae bacterium]HRW54285.1 hypothetical protein [Phycisphaerae bacterium]